MADLQAVIFDYGGVFTESPVMAFARYERREGLPERFISSVIRTHLEDGAFARFERAEIDLSTFDIAFAEETRAAGHEVRGSTLVQLLADVRFHEPMIAAFDAIRAAEYKTGCITNNFAEDVMPVPREPEVAARVREILGHFDHVIESSKVGVRKPEPAIYRMMAEALGVPMEACAFVDDLGVNLKPAAALGMRTVKVPFGNIDPAIAALEDMTGVTLRPET